MWRRDVSQVRGVQRYKLLLVSLVMYYCECFIPVVFAILRYGILLFSECLVLGCCRCYILQIYVMDVLLRAICGCTDLVTRRTMKTSRNTVEFPYSPRWYPELSRNRIFQTHLVSSKFTTSIWNICFLPKFDFDTNIIPKQLLDPASR